jgi:hypothetical protein
MIKILPIDRNISSFLTITEFVSFRRTCHLFYEDEEAWNIKAKTLPISLSSLNSKKTLGLHYILKWSVLFEEVVGSYQWYQKIVNWLGYKVSIKIFFSFIVFYNVPFLSNLNLKHMNNIQRFHWNYLYHRNPRLFKPKKRKYDELEERYNLSSKRPKTWFFYRRDTQPCYG